MRCRIKEGGGNQLDALGKGQWESTLIDRKMAIASIKWLTKEAHRENRQPHTGQISFEVGYI